LCADSNSGVINFSLHHVIVYEGSTLSIRSSVKDSPCRLVARQKADNDPEFHFREPTAADGQAVAQLVASCPPLDRNSLYCNLLQTTDFARTCIIAEREGEVVGWISGYRLPDEPKTMFVWQVAVHESARGLGLGVAMLRALFERPGVVGAERLVTTITRSNVASRRMFARFAEDQGAPLCAEPWFDRHQHFGGCQESEERISIGPLRSCLPHPN
jgi:L-2,4-diaminobutyric acid acetyltransferase